MARNSKRELLIDAADQLFYECTFDDTTLSKIATLSGVPLGNVYYYFRTKDDILRAVLKRRDQLLEELIAQWNVNANARTRLELFINNEVIIADVTAKYGNATGSLCQELSKSPGELSELAGDILHKILNWVADQFIQLGKDPKRATGLAEHLISNLQGVALLTVVFKDPKITRDHSELLCKWLEEVC